MSGMAASQKDIRSLSNLSESASTSRVLNLSHIYKLHASDSDYTDKPFFRNRQMNRSIILKHTVRQSERGLFSRPKRTATKIILPFDLNDLKLGGQSILVGQIGYDAFLKDIYDTANLLDVHDVDVLQCLDELPSLDPFLVREHLARRRHRPASCYLKISPADVARMIGFANSEIESLVSTAFGSALQSGTAKLASKILSDELDHELEPLRKTLRLSGPQWSEGIFSWRGFLYFKWRLLELQDELKRVLTGLSTYQPLSTRDRSITDFLNEIRPRLAKRIIVAIGNLTRTLGVYDRAYHALVSGRDPGPFRRFLVEGPSMFFELGENIGILSHISSFWNYRVKSGRGAIRLSAEEYADLLIDYEDSLSIIYVDENEGQPKVWA
ncbi:hypothetical protein ABI_06900 [Asticcacaulis biprosthecium C19]|uniref:Uncharacterized protein n=1 Tax=Asticcacaulis biprosthecium C19 TaxID=715226 RepID=F4QLB1_9CAUL|nr:hypothetical protein [Asticcacaulis biprosthecium]EGF92256.1 hypothetical protein ABI_06900 [Asticcacaulis biprosthecium C19]